MSSRGGIRRTGRRLCICRSCKLETEVDHRLGTLTRGRYLGDYEHKLHRKRELARQEREREMQANPVPSPPSTPILPVAPRGQTAPRADESPGNASTRTQTKTRTVDVRSSSLVEEIENALRHSSIEGCLTGGGLIFLNPPTFLSPSEPPQPDSIELNPAARENSRLLAQLRWLLDKRTILNSTRRKLDSGKHKIGVMVLLIEIEKQLRAIDDLKQKEWLAQQQAAVDAGGDPFDPGPSAHRFLHYDPITITWYIVLCILHLLAGLSLDYCKFVLLGARLIHRLSPQTLDTVHDFVPKDMRTVLKVMELEPTYERYVCCPRCFCFYAMDGEGDTFPVKCTGRYAGDSPECNRTLRRSEPSLPGGTPVWTPTNEVLYQSVKAWLGRMYCRLEIENHLDRSFVPLGKEEEAEVVDIWDSRQLRQFMGPDGKTPFLLRPGREGRVAFALNVDAFNPHGNRLAGKKVSATAVWIACLNLPPALRYLEENMCLVELVPKEPSLHEMNHILVPLVRDLKTLWLDGVYYKRTAKYPYGRRVRAALFPLTCDLVAARQVAGFGYFSAEQFCHLCTLPLEEVRNVDVTTWHPRTWEEHKRRAAEWLAAPTEAEKDRIYKTYGVRWSTLLELPYWNPIQNTVVDSMHGFYLRMFRHHCREIWGMGVQMFDGKPLSIHNISEMPDEEMMEGRRILRSGTQQELEGLPGPVLKQLCRETLLHFGGRRRSRWVRDLITYRISRGWFDKEGNYLTHETSGYLTDTFAASNPSSDTPTPASPAASQATTTLPLSNAPSGLPASTSSVRKKANKANEPPISSELAEKLYQTGSKTAINRLRRKSLVVLAVIKLKGYTRERLNDMTQKDIQGIVHEKRISEGILNEKGKIDKPRKPKQKKNRKLRMKKESAVLGVGTLQEIRDDMAKLKTPTWLSKAPNRPGEAATGKFSADQWRTFCSVNLPATLIRLWGGLDVKSEKYRMLVNFMALVTAVHYGTMRKVTPQHIQSYEYHMTQYVSTLLDLYPGTEITPYQHLSLHYAAFLRAFGPTHGWRCFAYERCNGRLQRIQTNEKVGGEMEKSMFLKFASSQNLRATLQPDHLPAAVTDLLSGYHEIFKSDIRGTLLDDMLAYDENYAKVEDTLTWTRFEETRLPNQTYELLNEWFSLRFPTGGSSACHPVPTRAYYRSQIKWLGQAFHARGKSFNSNSMVAFLSGNSLPNSEDWSAGCISEIFSIQLGKADGTMTFFVVDEYASLVPEDAQFDHYRKFPPLGGRIFYDKFNPDLVLVSTDQILGHFAYHHREFSGIRDPCIHAIPFFKEGIYWGDTQ